MIAPSRPKSYSIQGSLFGSKNVAESSATEHDAVATTASGASRFAPLAKLADTLPASNNGTAKVLLDGTVMQQGGAAAPPMPGPLDGLGLPTPKDIGDWLEELFGKGTGNPGPQRDGDDKEGKGKSDGQKRRPGPKVEDLYPKPGKMSLIQAAAAHEAQNASRAFVVLQPNQQQTTVPQANLSILQVSKQMRDLQNSIFKVSHASESGPTYSHYFDAQFASAM